MRENLIIVRNILFKSFILGFVLLLISWLLFIFKMDFYFGMAHNMFGIDKQSFLFAAVLITGMAKNVIFFLYLIPAIAIHWALKCKCQKVPEI